MKALSCDQCLDWVFLGILLKGLKKPTDRGMSKKLSPKAKACRDQMLLQESSKTLEEGHCRALVIAWDFL